MFLATFPLLSVSEHIRFDVVNSCFFLSLYISLLFRFQNQKYATFYSSREPSFPIHISAISCSSLVQIKSHKAQNSSFFILFHFNRLKFQLNPSNGGTIKKAQGFFESKPTTLWGSGNTDCLTIRRELGLLDASDLSNWSILLWHLNNLVILYLHGMIEQLWIMLYNYVVFLHIWSIHVSCFMIGLYSSMYVLWMINSICLSYTCYALWLFVD